MPGVEGENRVDPGVARATRHLGHWPQQGVPEHQLRSSLGRSGSDHWNASCPGRFSPPRLLVAGDRDCEHLATAAQNLQCVAVWCCHRARRRERRTAALPKQWPLWNLHPCPGFLGRQTFRLQVQFLVDRRHRGHVGREQQLPGFLLPPQLQGLQMTPVAPPQLGAHCLPSVPIGSSCSHSSPGVDVLGAKSKVAESPIHLPDQHLLM